MRALLTSGIKAILAVAALSTAVHWALRLQRDSNGLTTPAIASIADPETTGSIAPRASGPSPVSAPSAVVEEARQAVAPAIPRVEARKAPPTGLDQSHLASLIATATATTTAAPKKAAKR